MTPEEQAALDAAQEKQIRDLAQQITQMTKLGFDPLTIRKGVVAAVNDASNPPTVSINLSGDTTTLVAEVRTLNNYTPVVNQTVLVAKQGTEIFLLGSIASVNPNGNPVNQETSTGWIKATLTNGSHNGNTNGDIYYRRILDHGTWKMQWRGGWIPSGSVMLIDTANALDPDFRPPSKRTVLAARETQTGAIACQFDFHTNGTVAMVGSTYSTQLVDPPDYTDTRLSGYLSQAGSDLGHSHNVLASHDHTASAPAWVSLSGIEYFL